LIYRLLHLLYRKGNSMLFKSAKLVWLWRQSICNVWQALHYLFAYGIEAYRYKYGFDLDRMLNNLYDKALTNINFTTNGTRCFGMNYSVRFRVGRKSLDGQVLPGINNYMNDILENTDPSQWPELLLVCKAFYRKINDKMIECYNTHVFRQAANMMLIGRPAFCYCEGSEGDTASSCVECTQVKSLVLQEYSDYEAQFLNVDYFFMMEGEIPHFYRYLRVNNVSIEDFLDLADYFNMKTRLPLTIHTAAFILLYMGYRDQFIQFLVFEMPQVMFDILLNNWNYHDVEDNRYFPQ